MQSARLYLQRILELLEKHPWWHQQSTGFIVFDAFTVTEPCLSTNFIIEHLTMRFIKSRVGLTRIKRVYAISEKDVGI